MTTTPLPKLLMMSWSRPPAVSGSATVLGNLAEKFTPDEMVIIGENQPNAPALQWRNDLPKLFTGTRYINPKQRGARWLRFAQIPYLFLKSWWIARRHGCKAILVVYPNEVYLLVAYLLATLTRRPLYAYFHNLYAENIGVGFVYMPLAKWLQPRIFRKARHIFTMSAGMADYYQQEKRFVGNFSPLVHTFNEDIPPIPTSAPPVQTPLQLASAGSINSYCADSAGRIARAVSAMDVHMMVYTGVGRDYLATVGFVGDKFTITILPRVELLVQLPHADMVLLPHGFVGGASADEIKTIFPTKVIEYLICGKPIIAHTPEGAFLTDFLRQHDCAYVVTEPSIEAVREAITRVATDEALRLRLVQNALRTAEMFHAPNVVKHLREVVSLV